jgi:hypothetical protein
MNNLGIHTLGQLFLCIVLILETGAAPFFLDKATSVTEFQYFSAPPDDCSDPNINLKVLNPHNASETMEAKFCEEGYPGQGSLWLKSNATVAHIVKILPDEGVENINSRAFITWGPDHWFQVGTDIRLHPGKRILVRTSRFGDTTEEQLAAVIVNISIASELLFKNNTPPPNLSKVEELYRYGVGLPFGAGETVTVLQCMDALKNGSKINVEDCLINVGESDTILDKVAGVLQKMGDAVTRNQLKGVLDAAKVAAGLGLILDLILEASDRYQDNDIWILYPPSTSELTPTPSNTSTVVLVDSSGSMNELDQSGKIKLEAARDAANNTLEVIKFENRAGGGTANQAGLVDFNFAARVDAQLSQDISSVQTALPSLFAEGGTGMPDGLKTGIDILSQDTSSSKKIIILLSDGMANIGHGNDQSLDMLAVRQQVLDQATRAGQEGICIYTVGFGIPGAIGTVSGEASIDEELLKQIPLNAGCGDNYNAQNATELGNVYVEIRHVSTGNVLLSQSGQIAQDQRLDIGNVQVPVNQSLLLYTLNWPGSQLDPILLDPRGKQVDSQYPDASLSLSSTIASIIIENPRSGNWRVAAKGVDVPEGLTAYNAILSTRQGAAVVAPALGPGIVVVVFALAAGGFAIYAHSQRKSTRGKPTPNAKPASRATLVGLSGPFTGQTAQLQASGLVIGRSSGCNLRLVDHAVSRHHARIRYAQGSWYLQDLGSSGGTFVNGARVTATVLNDDDRIRIGSTEFEFHQ